MLKSFLLLTSIFILYSVNGQSFKAINDIHLSVLPLGAPLEIDSSLIGNQAAIDSVMFEYYKTQNFNLEVAVLLNDTTQIEKIHIKLGRTEGGNDIFEDYFVFDNNTPGGLKTYLRNGKLVTLGLGSYTNLNTIYIQVYIESTIGSTTPLFIKNINI